MNNTIDAINELCLIILTEKDYIDEQLADQYIQNLDHVISELNKIKYPETLPEIRSCILNNIIKYLRKYRKIEGTYPFDISPFSFDSGNAYRSFRIYFENKYKECNKNAELPPVFKFTFDYIQDISEHYRIFVGFYDTQKAEFDKAIYREMSTKISKEIRQNTSDYIKINVENKVKDAVKDATAEASISAKAAEKLAQKAAEDAEKAAQDAAKTAVRMAIKEQINDVTKNISETSVTILGIFASIVLTVVAGLFYSSSVIDNINSANFYRLISVAALVGFVCYSLIALMFRYIERIKYKNDEMPRFNTMSIIVSSILLLITIVFGILQSSESNNILIQNQSKVNASISFEVEQLEESIASSEISVTNEKVEAESNVNESCISDTIATE